MFFFGILMLLFLAVFFVINIGSAIAALVGLGMVVLQLVHRSKSFWPWIIAVVLLLGGVGSLGGAWGLYYAIVSSWPGTNWPEISWIAGYLVGGSVGVILGVMEVIHWKREKVKQTWTTFTAIFRATADEIAEMP